MAGRTRRASRPRDPAPQPGHNPRMGRHRPSRGSGVRHREAAASDRGRSGGTASRDRWAAIILAAISLALYSPSVRFGFVHADDVDLIAGNAAFLGDPTNLAHVFTRSYFQTPAVAADVETYYRPIVIASFMADTIAGGGAPGFFHATNAALHALASALLLAFIRRVGAGSGAAFAAALVFAVHPLNGQAVYWIPGRNELLLAVFVLAAWLAWLRASDTGRRRWLAAHGAAWLLALLSKETAIVFPLVWALHAWQARRGRDVLRPPVCATWLAALVAWIVLRTNALGWEASGDAVGAFAAAVWRNLPGMVATIGKVAVPIRLNVTPGAGWQEVAIGAAAIALVAAAFAWCLPWRTQAFVWGWCLLAFLPALGVSGLPAYEHRAYLPLAALACGAALAVGRCFPGSLAASTRSPGPERRAAPRAVEARRDRITPDAEADRGLDGARSARTLRAAESPAGAPVARAGGPREDPLRRAPGPPGGAGAAGRRRAGWGARLRIGFALPAWMRRRVLGIGLVVAVSVPLAGVTATRGAVYADPFRFWQDGAKDPRFGAKARVNLGQLYESIDRLDQAERQYRLALALDPHVPKAHNNLGVVLMALGRRDEAVAMFQSERALHPRNADAHYNLGLVRAGEGKLHEAIALWEDAIAANRAYIPAYDELARAYRAKQMPDRAAAFEAEAAAIRRRTTGDR